MRLIKYWRYARFLAGQVNRCGQSPGSVPCGLTGSVEQDRVGKLGRVRSAGWSRARPGVYLNPPFTPTGARSVVGHLARNTVTLFIQATHRPGSPSPVRRCQLECRAPSRCPSGLAWPDAAPSALGRFPSAPRPRDGIVDSEMRPAGGMVAGVRHKRHRSGSASAKIYAAGRIML